MISITFKSIHNDYRRVLNCLIIPKITDLVPSQTVPRERLDLPKGISLADPRFHIPASVDMLIGAGTSLSLFSIGSINLSQGNEDFYLQKTRLGWIIGGGLDLSKGSRAPKSHDCMLSDLKTTIERFWTIEEAAPLTALSQEEIECEAHFKQHVTRDQHGRYVVALPFKTPSEALGESRPCALKRLNGLHKRFEINPEFKAQYAEVIREYMGLGHMSLIRFPKNTAGIYLPHHGVVKGTSSTTRLRVVFDASAKSTSGLSLNETLMVGPNIQDDLFALVTRFRFYKYVLVADIEKMYRQVLIREEDRRFQKILWQENGRINEYQLNTVTFGLAPASFLAIRCLHQLSENEGRSFPLAAALLKRDLYVDNLITGSYTCREAREIYEQMTGLMNRARFNMRQWASNEPKILEGVSEKSLENEFKMNKNCVIKTLGMYWKAREDSFVYLIKTPDLSGRITKRIILSEIAKLFDPLGLLGPVILYAKLIMQDLWQSKVTWDESVPSSIHYNWLNFCNQIELVNDVSFMRKVSWGDAQGIELHGFCDASERGYGACLYVRSDDSRKNSRCSLLCSKSRVAPLKKLTIPRLELCGALLLTNLYKKVATSLSTKINSVTLWTDSQIVLHWLRTQPNVLRTFVSNRVAEIQGKTNINQWRHVRSEDNPADALSRGLTPGKFIKSKLWFNGPGWLCQDKSVWPKSEFRTTEGVIPETKQFSCLSVNVEFNLIERFSSFTRLKRVIALCCRFLSEYRQYKGYLRSVELNHAETVILRHVQLSCFRKKIETLMKNQPLNGKSRIRNLDPFVSEEGCLRVGGRLKNSALSFGRRHPVILPKSNFITDLIITHYHVTHLHAGVQATLYAMRQRFWPIDGRNQIKGIIRKCVTCFRAKPRLSEYKMGNLPSGRVINTRPFHSVGVDYCGPFFIKERKYRNQRRIKTYVAVFVCMAVKAIHIEIVSDLSTEGFLGALRRFIARRGKPESIYCDNATNFQGARNELHDIYVLLNSREFENDILNFSNSNDIKFHFIPPSSPHFGGLWEAEVKSYKHHFKRVATNALLTFEEFNTLSIEIESILNSRPLTPISLDPNDLSALTPGHFLIGDSLMSLPEPNFLPLPSNRLSAWQLVSKIRQDFWKRWNIEYLNELNIRQKWVVNTVNPNEGMLVIIREDNVPCMQWPLARIQQLHPGNDGIVRSVTLKTAKGIIKRAVKKIGILPISYQDKRDEC